MPKILREPRILALGHLKVIYVKKNYDEDFEDLPNEQLDAILKKFYSEVRTENGELYKKSSLTSLRHGINRYLSNQPSGKDIIHGKDFTVIF